MIYCNKNGREIAEDIARSVSEGFFKGIFTKEEHVPIANGIADDKDMFVIGNMNGNDEIWQVCEMVLDCTGRIIPHLYKARKIGLMFAAYA